MHNTTKTPLRYLRIKKVKHAQDIYREIYNISWKDIKEDSVEETVFMKRKPDKDGDSSQVNL